MDESKLAPPETCGFPGSAFRLLFACRDSHQCQSVRRQVYARSAYRYFYLFVVAMLAGRGSAESITLRWEFTTEDRIPLEGARVWRLDVDDAYAKGVGERGGGRSPAHQTEWVTDTRGRVDVTVDMIEESEPLFGVVAIGFVPISIFFRDKLDSQWPVSDRLRLALTRATKISLKLSSDISKSGFLERIRGEGYSVGVSRLGGESPSYCEMSTSGSPHRIRVGVQQSPGLGAVYHLDDNEVTFDVEAGREYKVELRRGYRRIQGAKFRCEFNSVKELRWCLDPEQEMQLADILLMLHGLPFNSCLELLREEHIRFETRVSGGWMRGRVTRLSDGLFRLRLPPNCDGRIRVLSDSIVIQGKDEYLYARHGEDVDATVIGTAARTIHMRDMATGSEIPLTRVAVRLVSYEGQADEVEVFEEWFDTIVSSPVARLEQRTIKLVPGTYDVLLFSDGFAPKILRGESFSSRGSKPILAQLSRGITVRGQFTGTSSQNVAQRAVLVGEGGLDAPSHLSSGDPNFVWSESEVGTRGEFEFSAVGAGHYRVRIDTHLGPRMSAGFVVDGTKNVEEILIGEGE